MDDEELVKRINELAEEEHHLERSHPERDGLPPADLARLEQIELALDQCWDLLRQRRARREMGLDPDDAIGRPPGMVEGYEQ